MTSITKLALTAASVSAAILVIAWVLFGFPGSTKFPDKPESIAEAFLSQIRSGKPDDAWTSTTAEFKSFMGRDRLRDFVTANKILRQPLKFDSRQSMNQESLILEELIFVPDSGKQKVRVLLAEEKSAWRVERLYVDENP
jgi:hypothetical protein